MTNKVANTPAKRVPVPRIDSKSVSCPKCTALPGESCVSDKDQFRRNAHSERLTKALEQRRLQHDQGRGGSDG